MFTFIPGFKTRGFPVHFNKLEARGEARGEKNGFEKGQYETAVPMFRKGYNDAQVKDILPDVSLEKLAEAKKEAQKHNS